MCSLVPIGSVICFSSSVMVLYSRVWHPRAFFRASQIVLVLILEFSEIFPSVSSVNFASASPIAVLSLVWLSRYSFFAVCLSCFVPFLHAWLNLRHAYFFAIFAAFMCSFVMPIVLSVLTFLVHMVPFIYVFDCFFCSLIIFPFNRPISRNYSHLVAVRGRCSISHVHAGTLGFTYMEIHTVKSIFV